MEARSLAMRDLPLARMTVAAALAMSALLLFVAVLLLVRLLSGGLSAKLDALSLLSISSVFLAVVAAPRLAGAWLASARDNRITRAALLFMPALAVVVIFISLSFTSLAIWPLVLVWIGLLAEEGVWWTLHLRRRPARNSVRAAPPDPPAAPLPLPAAETSREPALEDDEILADSVVQQLTRERDADGSETVHGVLRGDFAAGERNQNLHVAFCPPLSAVPEFTFEQVDGPAATIKAGQVEMFGVRLEVRLDAPPPEAAKLLVEFSAHAHPTERSG